MTQDDIPRLALGTVSVSGSAPFGALFAGDRAVPLAALRAQHGPLGVGLCAAEVRQVLERWPEQLSLLERAADELREHPGHGAASEQILKLPQLTVHAPFIPRNLFCTGANYRGHVAGLLRGDPSMRAPGSENIDPEQLARKVEAQLERQAKHARPYCFAKLVSCVAGPYDPLVLPRDVEKPDWELELAVVIGRPCRRVAARDAMQYVAGYAIINDITARELVFRRDGMALGADWLASKCQPGFAPFGPFLVPASEIDDVYQLQLDLTVNGTVMQRESTRDMLIDISRQVEHLSHVVGLQPGDVIATGSPAGNGSMHGVFLKPGDWMEGSITGLGTQRIRCVAESA